jgi:hypothetical protein
MRNRQTHAAQTKTTAFGNCPEILVRALRDEH